MLTGRVLDATERAYPLRPDAHVQLTHRPIERLSLSAGLRTSTFSLSEEASALSPRFSARLRLRPSLHLDASWGQYVQRRLTDTFHAMFSYTLSRPDFKEAAFALSSGSLSMTTAAR